MTAFSANVVPARANVCSPHARSAETGSTPPQTTTPAYVSAPSSTVCRTTAAPGAIGASEAANAPASVETWMRPSASIFDSQAVCASPNSMICASTRAPDGRMHASLRQVAASANGYLRSAFSLSRSGERPGPRAWRVSVSSIIRTSA